MQTWTTNQPLSTTTVLVQHKQGIIDHAGKKMFSKELECAKFFAAVNVTTRLVMTKKSLFFSLARCLCSTCDVLGAWLWDKL